MSELSRMSRRVRLAEQIAGLITEENQAVRAVDDFGDTDAARLARLTRQLGDVADAFLYGTGPLGDRLAVVAAQCMAWIDVLETPR